MFQIYNVMLSWSMHEVSKPAMTHIGALIGVGYCWTSGEYFAQ